MRRGRPEAFFCLYPPRAVQRGSELHTLPTLRAAPFAVAFVFGCLDRPWPPAFPSKRPVGSMRVAVEFGNQGALIDGPACSGNEPDGVSGFPVLLVPSDPASNVGRGAGWAVVAGRAFVSSSLPGLRKWACEQGFVLVVFVPLLKVVREDCCLLLHICGEACIPHPSYDLVCSFSPLECVLTV